MPALAPWERAHPGRPPRWAVFVDKVIAGQFVSATERELRQAVSPQALADLDGVWGDIRTWLAGRLSRLLRLAGPWSAYPVLARLIAVQCLNTVDAMAEMLDRLATDRDAIAATMFGGRSPGPLVSIRPGCGDPHAGGRSVAVLGFHDAGSVVYQPRSLDLHDRWNGLLAWLAGIAPDLAPRAVTVLPRGEYGWAEYVPALPCGSTADVEMFYRRMGALLALFHALGATDVHCENVIACGSHPVLVDVETLFHPSWPVRTDLGADPARTAMDASVLRTSVLPRFVVGSDVSAIGGRGQNSPIVDHAAPDPTRYLDEVLDGFHRAYQLITANAHGLLAGFADTKIRVVARGTSAYAESLAESTRPEHLRDAQARIAVFTALLEEPGHDHLSTLAAAELRQLFDGDLPLFTAEAGGRDVLTADGEVLPGLLSASGLAVATAKVSAMGPDDLRDQDWIIRATLAPMPSRPLDGPCLPRTPTPDRLLELAAALGDDLLARACRGAGRVNWLGFEPEDDAPRWSVRPMGASLGDGYSGVALFLAYLGALSGDDRYLDLAAGAAAPLPRLMTIIAGHPGLAGEVGADIARGLGGICYAIGKLAELLNDSRLAAALPVAVRAAGLAARSTAEPRRCGRTKTDLGWCSGLVRPGTPAAERFLALLVERPPGGDHSLCHGELGALDVAIELTAQQHPAVAAAGARTVGSIERYGPLCGTPGSVPTPGLLSGTAGIGFGLLRLGFPGGVPPIPRPEHLAERRIG